MPNQIYRLFLPVATWRTRRGEVELQRELCCLPRSENDLRRLINTGQAAPAERGSYCVQFGGGGHYFDDRRAALAYRRVIAIFEARLEAEKWQNRANPGGGDTQC